MSLMSAQLYEILETEFTVMPLEERKKAIEVQKYASNATLSVNLFVNIDGISQIDILAGPSNGLELLNFFGGAIEQVNFIGNILNQ